MFDPSWASQRMRKTRMRSGAHDPGGAGGADGTACVLTAHLTEIDQVEPARRYA
jgi:hypothetical protein